MTNPNQTPLSTRQPTGRRIPGSPASGGGGGGGGIATVYSTGPTYGPPSLESRQVDTGPTHTYRQAPGGGVYGSGNWWAQRNQRSATFNEPDIPGFNPWEGEKWVGEDYQGGVVDTSALIDATEALLNERLGGEMSEAARRFGQAGALMSGGGLGGGYAGTLAESERGVRRDLGEMAHRYRFQAEQSDADRRAAAFNAAQERSLRAHEGYEGRRFGGWGAESDYDRWKYGAELGRSGREQQSARDMLLALYGN